MQNNRTSLFAKCSIDHAVNITAPLGKNGIFVSVMQKPSIPKGTRDFGPEMVRKRRYIMDVIRKVFETYGFMPLETPAMENLATLEGKYGEEGDKLLFRILNSGDAFADIRKRYPELKVGEAPFRSGEVSEKGLRYDLTVPFARYVVMNRNEITFPFRRYQMQPVWRADRPQKGRYREFWQCDADVVGSDSLMNEVDLIRIYHDVFVQLGLSQYRIKLNNRKILSGIAETVRSQDLMMDIAIAIDKIDKIGEDGVKTELTGKGFTMQEQDTLFQLISISGKPTEIIHELKNQLQGSAIGLIGLEEMLFISEQLNDPQLTSVNWELDFSLARGLNYYTGCILEATAGEGTLQSSIGGGGRYDDLTGIFGMPGVSGVGLSFGLDRIYDVLDELNRFPSTHKNTGTVVLGCAFDGSSMKQLNSVLHKIREAGIPAELYPDLPKSKKELEKPMYKPMTYADKLGIPYALLLRDGQYTLRDMNSKVEEVLPIEVLIQQLTSISTQL